MRLVPLASIRVEPQIGVDRGWLAASDHNPTMSKYQNNTTQWSSIWYNITNWWLLLVQCILWCSSGDLLSYQLWMHRIPSWLGRIDSFQLVTVTTHPTASDWRWTSSAVRTLSPILLSSIVLFWGHLVQRWPRKRRTSDLTNRSMRLTYQSTTIGAGSEKISL